MISNFSHLGNCFPSGRIICISINIFRKYVCCLLFSINVFWAQAQVNNTVVTTGVVKSTDGNTLPGVSVKGKNSKNTTITDANGKFRITIKSNDILVFSFLGFETQERQVTQPGAIDVVLKEKTSSLDEVVVIGYGTSKRSDLTGAISIVKVDELAKAPVASFDQALAGRIAGVQVSSNEGQPGKEGVNIVIRGNGSLTQSNSPLYVLDGFPMEDFDAGSISISDIEKINVLKDASATAIYGARGANGVVIIETKRGKAGAPRLTYNGSYGIQDVVKTIDLMDAYDFVRYQIDRGNGERYLTDGRTLESYRGIKGVDWQDKLFRTGRTNIHNLAIQGGNSQTKYYVSGSAFKSDAVIINTGYNRYQGRIALDQNINSKIKAGANINYSSQRAYGMQASTANMGGSGATSYLLFSTWGYRPIGTDKDFSTDDLENSIIDESDDINPNQDYRANPILSANNEHRVFWKRGLSSNLYLNYEIIKNLVLRINGGLSGASTPTESFYNSQTIRGTPLFPANAARGSWGNKTSDDRFTWSNENTLTYKRALNKNHFIEAMGGFTFQKSTSELGGYTAIKVPNESLGIRGLRQGEPSLIVSNASEFTLQSYISRLNYNYKSKYLLTASFRADGSSKFTRGNRWGFFPSGALAWRMENEPFVKNLSVVSEAKLRMSYGLTGNNRVSDYASFALLDPTYSSGYSFGNEMPLQGVNLTSMGNSSLKWETIEQFDIGYDLGLFQNRLQLTVDIYRRTTRDLLLNANMPLHTGFETVYKNIGKVRNQGLEFTFNTVNIKTKNFRWESNFNISLNENKVLALTEGENNIRKSVGWNNDYTNTPLYIAKIGQPSSQLVGYLWDGVYQYSDFVETSPGVYKLKSEVPAFVGLSNSTQPGTIKYKDINGDGIINDNDITVIGRGLPIHTGGFSNNFSYKNFELSFLFQWSYGNDIFNANRIMFEGTRVANLNQYASYNERWTPENQSNIYFRTGGEGQNGVYSSRTVEDGSYLRLKTLSFSYDVPSRFLTWVKIKSIGLTATAQNLFTWTKYSGLDPEVSTFNSALTSGFDYSAYPHARTIVFGIKAIF